MEIRNIKNLLLTASSEVKIYREALPLILNNCIIIQTELDRFRLLIKSSFIKLYLFKKSSYNRTDFIEEIQKITLIPESIMKVMDKNSHTCKDLIDKLNSPLEVVSSIVAHSAITPELYFASYELAEMVESLKISYEGILTTSREMNKELTYLINKHKLLIETYIAFSGGIITEITIPDLRPTLMRLSFQVYQ